MVNSHVLQQLFDPQEARNWASDSLDRGSRFAGSVLRGRSVLSAHIAAARLLPEPFILSHAGQGMPPSGADTALNEYLRGYARERDWTLLVDDDLARPSDPGIPDTVLLSEDRILWPLASTSSNATPSQFIRAHSSGYPSNAFICFPALDLTRSYARPLSESDEHAIAERVCLVVCSAFDDEAFVVLELTT
jgi:hypothetical protein